MDDSFRARADRVFGSLNTTSSAGVSPAPWRLTEKKIERREWRQSKDHDDEEELKEEHSLSDVVSRSFVSQDQLESDLQELSDNEEEDEKENEDNIICEKIVQRTGDDAADEFANVQGNIGRDCTLDQEEEEDEYDKVAVDKDHTVDRLYMRDVKYSDYGIEQFTAHSELPNSFHFALKDPRANHEAAKARLKEDAEAAGDLDTFLLIDNSIKDQSISELDGAKPKPILKRKENPPDSRSQKRVRFSVDVKSGTDTNEEQQLQEAGGDSVSEPGSANNETVPEQTSNLSQYLSSVPDYIRNPSRYTRYTFDSTNDMGDQSNRKAHRDFFNHLRKEKSGDDSTENEIPVEIPKSIVFTPRKKSDDYMGKNEDGYDSRENHGTNKGPSTLVSAEEAQEDKASAMEEDEPPVMVNKQKQGRHYRTKTNVDLDDDDMHE